MPALRDKARQIDEAEHPRETVGIRTTDIVQKYERATQCHVTDKTTPQTADKK
jgi:hypothetical protein